MTIEAVSGDWNEKADLRRGACPTLGRPMVTGDGLLARMRLDNCRLTLAQLRAVAQAAAAHGNGIIEVTARGSLQIRGLKPESITPLEQAVFDAGITPASGLMVEVPPLAGIDPEELIDPRPVAADIRRLVAERRPLLVLAPKLAVVVDGGEHLHLGAVTADVRLTAVDGDRFLLAVGGTNGSARKIRMVGCDEAAPAAIRVLEAIAAIGPAARGKDVDVEALDGLFDARASEVPLPVGADGFLGIRSLASLAITVQSDASSPEAEFSDAARSNFTYANSYTLGIALPYRQARAAGVIKFLDEIEIIGISDIRLSPGHGLILTGLNRDGTRKAELAARRHGFWTSQDEPRASISLCAGKAGCASAHFETHEMGETFARLAPVLFDGSIALHLSGCPKGCAHPSPAPLALVGAPSGYGLVVNGAASDRPDVYIAAKDLEIALQRLASLVAGAKEAGETARECLARLGRAAIAAAMTLDGQ